MLELKKGPKTVNELTRKLNVEQSKLSHVLKILKNCSFIKAKKEGQYYKGTEFQGGTYDFNFSVYDAKIGGNICFSNITTLTIGSWGEWKTEQFGVGSACNNDSKDYYLEIKINNEIQDGRRLLRSFPYLRQDAPILFNSYNYSGTARWQIKNINSGNTSNTLFSVTNDLGYLLSFGITSSNYFSIPNNKSFANQPSIGQSSFNDLYFINGRQTGFSWFNNPFNDTSNAIQKIMVLDSNGNLNTSGNITTTQTGFFGWLGSLTSRINKLFVQDIDVGGNINVTGNISNEGNILSQGNITAKNGLFTFLGSSANKINKLFVKEIDVENSIKIGYTVQGVCNSSAEGVIIYDSATNKREFWGCRQKTIGQYEWVKLS